MAPLTTTSYAILGLLAIRPWTTYEIAQQMQRSLSKIWPRAQSRIYEEPKRLAELGLATAQRDHTGRRPRTTYTITDAGRTALKQWLATPGSGPVLEFESLLQVFYAEHSTKTQTRARIREIRSWAAHQNAENIAFARLYLGAGAPFPERIASVVLIGKFITDFADMVAAWADWADDKVAAWPPRGRPEPAWDVLDEIAAREDLPLGARE
jgi:PadR family transcriptional regulator, regulatory protein AphA